MRNWLWTGVMEPYTQSLLLVLLTVFVLGCQFTLWMSGQPYTVMATGYATLLCLYLIKTLKHIKNYKDDNSPPKDA